MGIFECVQKVGKNILGYLIFTFFCVCILFVFLGFPLVKIIIESFVCLNQFWRHGNLKNLEAILSLASILVFYLGQVISSRAGFLMATKGN